MVENNSRPNRGSDPPEVFIAMNRARDDAVRKAAKKPRRKPRGQWAKRIKENLGYISWICLALTGLSITAAAMVDALWQLWRAIVRE